MCVLVVGFGIFGVYKWLNPPANNQIITEDDESVNLPQADPSIIADLKLSSVKPNAVILSVSGMGGKIKQISYEFTYDSEGLIKGVNSGSQPLDTGGKDIFEREIYLGTCSKNVCTPDKGVKNISVDLVFIDTSDKKSQLTKDFDL